MYICCYRYCAIHCLSTTGLGILSFDHRSFAHLLICLDCSDQMSDCERFAQIAQDKWATVSKSHRSLMPKEWPWANCSRRSWQESDHEGFAQGAHDKRVNEQISNFLEQISHLLFYSQKASNSLKNCWLKSYFLVRFCTFFCKFKKIQVIRSFPFF